jgi:hypothetical protein
MRLLKLIASDAGGAMGMYDNMSYRVTFNGDIAGFASRNPQTAMVEVVVMADSQLGLERELGSNIGLKLLDSVTIQAVVLNGGSDGENAEYVRLFGSDWIEF